MLTSLIVPVYNAGQYLREFLDSVKAQTLSEFEAVFVDDGSTDDSLDILDEYAKSDNRFKVIHKENGGVVSAWKRGVKESRGEFLAFADPDDIMDPDMLKTQGMLMTQNDADIVITGVNKLENGKVSRAKVDYRKLEDGLYDGEKLEGLKRELFGTSEKLRAVFVFYKYNKLFKRGLVVDNLDYTDDRVAYGDDICICAAAVYDSHRLFFKNDPLYMYRVHDNSITTARYAEAEADNAKRVTDSIAALATAKGYMNEHITLGYPAFHIIRLIKKICCDPIDNKRKKQLLRALKRHALVRDLPLVKSKKHISKNRWRIIALLKLGIYFPILNYYAK